MMAKIPKRERMSNQRNDFIAHLLIRIDKTILSHFRQMENHLSIFDPKKEGEKQGFKLFSVH